MIRKVILGGLMAGLCLFCMISGSVSAAEKAVPVADFNFQEGAGDVFKDSVNPENTGLLKKDVSWVKEGGLAFPGLPGSFASIQLSSPELKNPKIEMWIQPDLKNMEFKQWYGILVGPCGNGYGGGYRLLSQKKETANPGKVLFSVYFQMNFGDPNPKVISNVDIELPEEYNKLVYVCASYDHQNMELKVEETSKTLPENRNINYNGKNQLAIGQAQWPFLGVIKRLKISEIGK